MEMTEEQLEQAAGVTKITVPARAAAIGWINAYLGASQSEGRPALYRKLSLEIFSTGLQIVCCDGYVLFRSWVPTKANSDWPSDRSEPLHSLVAMDTDAFALAFMRGIARVTNSDDRASELMELYVAPFDEEAAPALGEEFRRERLTLRACGQRLDVPLYEDKFADWRNLRYNLEIVERVEGLSFTPSVIGLLGKCKEITSVDLTFFGERTAVGFHARGAVEMRGLIMPRERRED